MPTPRSERSSSRRRRVRWSHAVVDLKEHGYDVTTAPGGQGLLQAVESDRPDLLLLDIMMPKVDGLQLLERLKTTTASRTSPSDGVVEPARGATVKSSAWARPTSSPTVPGARAAGAGRGPPGACKALAQARERAARGRRWGHPPRSPTRSSPTRSTTSWRGGSRACSASPSAPWCSPTNGHAGRPSRGVREPDARNLQSSGRAIPKSSAARHRARRAGAGRVHRHLYEQSGALGARGHQVPTRSAVALPFSMKDPAGGVFCLRTTGDDPG